MPIDEKPRSSVKIKPSITKICLPVGTFFLMSFARCVCWPVKAGRKVPNMLLYLMSLPAGVRA